MSVKDMTGVGSRYCLEGNCEGEGGSEPAADAGDGGDGGGRCCPEQAVEGRGPHGFLREREKQRAERLDKERRWRN